MLWIKIFSFELNFQLIEFIQIGHSYALRILILLDGLFQLLDFISLLKLLHIYAREFQVGNVDTLVELTSLDIVNFIFALGVEGDVVTRA